MAENPYITRKIESTILKFLETPEIIAVVGPRQCGKTTLLRHIFDGLQKQGKIAVFLTFEDKKILDVFTADIDEFIELYIKPNSYIFIDEFQYAKKGGKLLKYIYDSTRKKILVSGSSSLDLTVQAVKYLVGRVFVFSLYPFDFGEFLSFRDSSLFNFYQNRKISLTEKITQGVQKPLSPTTLGQFQRFYQEYLVYGGYPRVVLSSDFEEKKAVLKSIYNTYFLREVKDILGLVDDFKLAQMIKALALQAGNLIEYQEISSTAGLSYQTVKGYLNFLEKTFIALLVKPYFRNKRTEIVKNPKVYFCDTGLRNYIVNDFRGLNERNDSGALLENGLAMQFIKQDLSFNFWRAKNQLEIDFVVDLPNRENLALEVKKGYHVGDAASRAVKEFNIKYPSIPLWFCYFDDNKQNKDRRAFFLPML